MKIDINKHLDESEKLETLFHKNEFFRRVCFILKEEVSEKEIVEMFAILCDQLNDLNSQVHKNPPKIKQAMNVVFKHLDNMTEEEWSEVLKKRGNK